MYPFNHFSTVRQAARYIQRTVTLEYDSPVLRHSFRYTRFHHVEPHVVYSPKGTELAIRWYSFGLSLDFLATSLGIPYSVVTTQIRPYY